MDILGLQKRLDELSVWRKQELIQAQILVENAQTNDAVGYLCRAWVLIIYAHCDSFLKEAAKVYLEYVKANQSFDYNYKFMWLIMKGKAHLMKGDKHYRSLSDYHSIEDDNFFNAILGDEVFKSGSFQYTQLRFFCDWVLQISYDHTSLQSFCKILKNKRDAIAHGERTYVKIEEDCLPWHKAAIEFIDSFKESLLENALKQRI